VTHGEGDDFEVMPCDQVDTSQSFLGNVVIEAGRRAAVGIK
jgi:hypothetical protein